MKNNKPKVRRTDNPRKMFIRLCQSSEYLHPVNTEYGMMSYNSLSSFNLKPLTDKSNKYLLIKFYVKEKLIDIEYNDSSIGKFDIDISNISVVEFTNNINKIISDNRSLFV